MEPGFTPVDLVTEQGFSMLDLLLCDWGLFSRIRDLRSIHRAALATDHFLVRAAVEMPRRDSSKPARSRRQGAAALEQKDIQR
eukprot:8998889-Pyramimonas_sp.AAC.1